MTTPTFGVVIVNWNGYADTLACVASLAAATPGPRRVVIVDNGSTDGSLEALRAWHGPLSLRLIAAGANLGFSAANNIGLGELAADSTITHFLLLNNDATVEPDFFNNVAEALAQVPDAGLLGPTIYVAGEPGAVWFAGGHFVPWRALVIHEVEVPRDRAPVPTEFVTGCAMLISRAALKVLGPLPESYFIYFEDAEYSWRAREAGLRVVYAPGAVAHHAVGAAVRRAYPNPRVAFLHTRHRALFARRNLRGLDRWVATAYLLATKPVRALVELLRGRPRLGAAMLRGTLQGLLAKDGKRVAGESAAVQDARNRLLVDD